MLFTGDEGMLCEYSYFLFHLFFTIPILWEEHLKWDDLCYASHRSLGMLLLLWSSSIGKTLSILSKCWVSCSLRWKETSVIPDNAPRQFVGLPEVFKLIWKRGVNASSAPPITSLSRKERVSRRGRKILSTESGVFICPGTASILFRANTEGRVYHGSQPTCSIPVLLERESSPPVSWKWSEGDEQGPVGDDEWTLPTSPGNTRVQLCSENVSDCLFTRTPGSCPRFFFFFHSLSFWDENFPGG